MLYVYSVHCKFFCEKVYIPLEVAIIFDILFVYGLLMLRKFNLWEIPGLKCHAKLS